MDRIDISEYTDNTPVSGSSNLPEITILNWDNIKNADQAVINAIAIAKGFEVA